MIHRSERSLGALTCIRAGCVDYARGLALQERLVEARRRDEAPDTLILLEHDAVVTLGRAADPAHVLLDRERLAKRGISLFETGRGGDVTLHSPGQVVGYPIVALRGERRDTHLYLRDLEDVMILAARDFGVESGRIETLTGIWAGDAKLGAIGVRLNSGWITSHGFAFNVANDLSLFDLIVPCGIRGRGVTSLSRLLGRPVEPAEAMDRLEARFREVFGTVEAAPIGEVDAVRARARAAGRPEPRTGPACNAAEIRLPHADGIAADEFAPSPAPARMPGEAAPRTAGREASGNSPSGSEARVAPVQGRA